LDLASIPYWEPIGTDANKFRGVFDGNGKSVSNLTSRSDNADKVGMFGVIDGPNVEVKNLNLVNINVLGKCNVGTVVGQMAGNAKVTNCKATGSVESTEWNAGGIVGKVWWGGRITGCTFSGTIVDRGNRRGGILGDTDGGNVAIVENCYVTGATMPGDSMVGGTEGGGSESTVNTYGVYNITKTLDDVNSTVAGKVYSSSAKTVNVILAKFDVVDGVSVLKGVSISPKVLVAKTADVFSVTLPKVTGTEILKIFSWEDGTLSPISTAISL